jgi:hypothetical protein
VSFDLSDPDIATFLSRCLAILLRAASDHTQTPLVRRLYFALGYPHLLKVTVAQKPSDAT